MNATENCDVPHVNKPMNIVEILYDELDLILSQHDVHLKIYSMYGMIYLHLIFLLPVLSNDRAPAKNVTGLSKM